VAKSQETSLRVTRKRKSQTRQHVDWFKSFLDEAPPFFGAARSCGGVFFRLPIVRLVNKKKRYSLALFVATSQGAENKKGTFVERT